MIDGKMSESDKKVLKQLIGEEAYAKLERLERIVVTYIDEN